MAKLYVWTEGSWTIGVVASEERIIEFKYLTEHSHTGIKVSTGIMPLRSEEALIKGKAIDVYETYESFLLTCPSSGLWKLMSDNTWINHE